MVANRIWILIGKKVSGEATLQELEELRSLIAGSERSAGRLHFSAGRNRHLQTKHEAAAECEFEEK